MNNSNARASRISDLDKDVNAVSAEVLQPRQPGFAKDLLAGVDTDALLATSLEELFEEYTPSPEPPTNSTHQP